MSQLMLQYSDAMRRTAHKLIGKALQSHLDSVDLVQSVQITLWIGLRTGKFSVDKPENFLSLANTLLRRKVARYWRNIKTRITISDTLLGDTWVDQAVYPPAHEPSRSLEFDDLVDRFLDQLSDIDRQLVKLRFKGCSTAEAARHLNLDPGFLRVRLGRLRKRFAQFRESLVNTPPTTRLPDPSSSEIPVQSGDDTGADAGN
ncbi:MAG: sigma-70 family RNA polymerase sigma factor [Gemmataceae bacterium]|nr:sigma-70 family RNA polymerase sigma factor [Gemmataceae bacterium]